MGQTQSVKKVNFEDVCQTLSTNNNYILINTLDMNEQNCLIKGTITPEKEIMVINKNLNNTNLRIIIYGKNSADESILKKYNQLNKLGFYNIYLYSGGIFEWLLLQDIYGTDNFPTTTKELDHLKYRARSTFNYLLTNID
jgi:hypothetical protein|tara:strand:+ start:1500 stop:1919 length:420 start_codon:yes stop_codon:yes gene_type:complete